MDKLAIALGGLLMTGAVLAPLAAAHKDSGAHNSAVIIPAPAGWAAGVKGSPAGFYYGAASAWLQLTANELAKGPTLSGCPNPTSTFADPVLCALSGLPINPSLTLAAADFLCDMEVLGDGATIFTADEHIVNGVAGASQVPDGTFDDGGIGAVCHTPFGFYVNPAYNADGCSGPTVKAFAKDEATLDPWISTSCDSTSPIATDGLLEQLLSVATCTVNHAISDNATDVGNGCVVRFTDCAGITAGSRCTTGPFGTSCVPDGVSDGGNNGFGSSGVPYGDLAPGCSHGGESAFVWNAVQIDTTGGPNHVSAATVGWIN